MEHWLAFKTGEMQGFLDFCGPGVVDPKAIQRELLRQGAYLSPSVEAAAALGKKPVAAE